MEMAIKSEYNKERKALIYFNSKNVPIEGIIEDVAKIYLHDFIKVGEENAGMPSFLEKIIMKTMEKITYHIPKSSLNNNKNREHCSMITRLVLKCMAYGKGNGIMGVYETMALDRDILRLEQKYRPC